jgi:hypothetical protein
VVVVLAGEGEVLESAGRCAFQEIAEVQIIDLAHARPRHRIDAGHHGTVLAEGPLADAKGGLVAGIRRNILGFLGPKPGVIRRLALEVAGRPNAMGKGLGPGYFGASDATLTRGFLTQREHGWDQRQHYKHR